MSGEVYFLVRFRSIVLFIPGCGFGICFAKYLFLLLPVYFWCFGVLVCVKLFHVKHCREVINSYIYWTALFYEVTEKSVIPVLDARIHLRKSLGCKEIDYRVKPDNDNCRSFSATFFLLLYLLDFIS